MFEKGGFVCGKKNRKLFFVSWNICYSVDASGCSAKDLKNVVVLAEFLP